MTKDQFKHFVLNGNSGWLRVSVILFGLGGQTFYFGIQMGEIKTTIKHNYENIRILNEAAWKKSEHDEFARGLERELDHLNRRETHESDRENKKA